MSGFYDGALDGEFGEKTLDALKAFQEINRLKSDGIVGPKTISVLKNRGTTRPRTSAPVSVFI